MNRFQCFDLNHDQDSVAVCTALHAFQCGFCVFAHFLWQSILNLNATKAPVDSVQILCIKYSGNPVNRASFV